MIAQASGDKHVVRVPYMANICHFRGIDAQTLTLKWHTSSFQDKGKAIPLQTLTGPDGARSLKLPDFKTIGT
jgi:hypothetical protein